MSNRAHLFVFVAVLVLLASLPLGAFATSEDEPDRNTIGVYGYKFDPLVAEPAIPQALRIDASTTGSALYLVQFAGPVTDEWLAQVRAAGLVPLQYYAHNAYLVWGDGAALGRLAGEPFLRWTGAFQPAYKLNPNMVQLAGVGEIKNVAVTFYDDGDAEKTLSRLAALGVYIRHFPAQPDGSFYTAVLSLPGGAVSQVARIPTVWAIDYAPPRPGLDDENGAQIVGGQWDAQGLPPAGYYDWLATKGVSGWGIRWANVDTGVERSHPDLQGRLAAYVAYPGAGPADADPHGHGSHTAGIIAGDGRGGTGIVDPSGFYWGTGVAPKATLIIQNALLGTDWPPAGGWQRLSRDSFINGAIGSNNSWSTGAYSTHYTAACRAHDLMVRNADWDTNGVAEEFIMIFSAGNRGPQPATLSEPHAAKNVITVGASDNYPRHGTDLDNLAPFSSRGPTADGRLAPTLVAPGSYVASLNGSDGNKCGEIVDGAGGAYYNACSGTSMAAPFVSGAAVLIAEWWAQEGRGVPSPAMVKALLVNGASDMAEGQSASGWESSTSLAHIPSNDQGWGRVNLDHVIRTRASSVYLDQEVVFGHAGETWEQAYVVADATKPVKISLVWTDAAGGAGANPALVNDLDLTVVNGGRSYLGNVFANGWTSTGGAPDRLNNIEGVYLPHGIHSQLEIRVTAANIAGDGIPNNGDGTDQDFALVIQNAELPAAHTVFAPLLLH